MPNYFTVSPDSQVGDVYATEFVYTASLPSEFVTITWDLGNDKFVYNESQVTTTYNYPGVYRVSLSAWNEEGFLISETTNINVDYVYRDVLDFTKLPSQNGIPGQPTYEPFKLYILSSKINDPISVTFQAFNTKSVPHYAVPEKWRFITPTWRFVDASTNEILDGPIPINVSPIYKNSKVVAVSGEASFYYIDDLATGRDEADCPLLLAATLSTENFSYPPESLHYPYYSYSNSEVARAVISWQINDVIPTKLKVTENYLNDIYPVKWSGVPIPVMITCQFDPIMLDEFENASVETTDVLAYPRTNELGSSSTVKIVLSSADGLVPEDLYTVEVQTESGKPAESFKASEAPLYFQAFDELDNSTSGYIFTTITPLTSFGENTSLMVAVSTVATNQIGGTINSFPFPDGYPIYPNVYISHPLKSTINKVNITTYPATCDSIVYYKSLGILVEGSASSITVPQNTKFDVSNYSLSGSSGVYGMAFDPIKNKLYAADADLDQIYTFDEGTTLAATVQLSSLTNNNYNVPSYISIDKTNNLWVSLYSNERLLKLDSNLNLLLSATPNLTLGLSAYGSMLISPPIVETDRDSNVWACYSHELSSMLVKYDGTTGQQILSAENFSLSSVPVSLAIDVQNNLWVACQASHTIKRYSGTTGTLMETLTGFYHPSYIALDRPGNLWITHGKNFCSVYNTITHEIKHWKFESYPASVTEVAGYTPQDIQATLYGNEIWGGLAVDVYSRVWAIDSEKNTIFGFNIGDPEGTYRTFNAFPNSTENYVVLGGSSYMTSVPEEYVRSAQAAGDWTGNRWYQKYAGDYVALGVHGISAPFKIYDVDSSYSISKVNEEFDYAAYVKSLALPEILNQNDKLFDEMIGPVAGTGDPTKESVGRIAYERISNFINTHGDLETSEVPQLIDFAEQLSVAARDYGSNFPTEINRLINLFSVPKHRLRGQIVYESDISNNIGKHLTALSLISAGQYIFVKDKRYETNQLIYVSPLSSGNVLVDIENQENILSIDGKPIDLPSPALIYPLSSIDVDGLRTPLFDNYHFFEYNEEQIGYAGNIINWDSDYTTIDYTLSSFDEWYGDNGLVETMFNNILTKRLIVE